MNKKCSSRTFDEAQRNSNEIWKFEMWNLANEFDNMPGIPEPFNIVQNVYAISVHLFRKRRHRYRVSQREKLEKQNGGKPTAAESLEVIDYKELYDS